MGLEDRKLSDNQFPIFPMPEQHIWTGSPSQVKNTFPFVFAVLAALGILFLTLVFKFWPPGVGFVGIPAIYGLCRWLSVRAQQFELTSERLLTSRGFLTRTTHSLELYRVKDMSVVQPFADQIRTQVESCRVTKGTREVELE
jgi:hypothetical protein